MPSVGTPIGVSPLDGPPPAPPEQLGTAPMGGSSPTLSGLSQPLPTGAADLPPEILTGITQACQKILGMYDSFAQVTPDLAMDWDLCKTVLNKVLGKVLAAGGGPSSPTATGNAFPGGGTDAGLPQQGP